MIELLVLLGSVFGSATTAALLSNWWQARRLRAEALHSEYRAITESLGKLMSSMATVVGTLRGETRHPNIWDYQRERCEASMKESHQSNFEISSRVAILSALEPELSGMATRVSERGFELLTSLASIHGWAPNPDVRGGIRTLLVEGQSCESVANDISLRIEGLQQAAAALTADVASQRKSLLTSWSRSRSEVWLIVMAVALLLGVACIATFWFAPRPQVFPDRVVWVSRLDRSVRVEWLESHAPCDPIQNSGKDMPAARDSIPRSDDDAGL